MTIQEIGQLSDPQMAGYAGQIDSLENLRARRIAVELLNGLAPLFARP